MLGCFILVVCLLGGGFGVVVGFFCWGMGVFSFGVFFRGFFLLQIPTLVHVFYEEFL